MKYLIYYEEDQSERTIAEIEHLKEDVSEAATQAYLRNRWSAWIFELLLDGQGATQEEARESLIKRAYGLLAHNLKEGRLQTKELMKVEFEDATEVLSSEEISQRLIQLHQLRDIAAE